MRFYNSGQYLHQIGRSKDTGEMVESYRPLKPDGYLEGTAIVNFPDLQFRQTVKRGDWIDVPESMFSQFNHKHDEPARLELSRKQTIHAVKSACPSLLTEDEAAPLLAAVAEKKGK